MSSSPVGVHTKQEILSQPENWGKTLKHLERLTSSLYPNISEYNQIVFLGCISTSYLSRWAARACQKGTGIASRAVSACDQLFFKGLDPDYPTNLTCMVVLHG